ncbi:MAG: SIR2 family protein [Gammaproteobacteria bacterium]|nr:SIR2 family protein [Gammaproteobacteria bacterium]
MPDVKELEKSVLDELSGTHRDALQRVMANRTLEEALSRFRRISALLGDEDTVDGLTASNARELDALVCRAIVKALQVEEADQPGTRCLAAWAARASYVMPLELFTVNYDLLLEAALEKARATYFDGFMGNIEARFQTELVESMPGTDGESLPSFLIRLWKLHGSLNWMWTDDGELVRIGQAVPEGRAAAIYPSDAKYEESRRVPFVVLQDRLRRSLNEPETLVLISGYSFGDEHVNEVLFDSALRRERSEYIAFCFDEIPEHLADRASVAPNLQVVSQREAIVGGIRDAWKDPDHEMPGLWDNDGLTLCDFNQLARYLARSTAREYGGAQSLSGVLTEVYGAPGGEGVTTG